jgi:molybdate transport system substrate-binding protein
MKSLKKGLVAILCIGVIAISAGCTSFTKDSSNKATDTTAKGKNTNTINLTVSAAASLKDSMDEIEKIYTKENPNVKITYDFGASGTLQQQIEQGAPVDVFISAATKQMNELKNKGLLVNNTDKNLLENSLVLIVPKDSSTVKDFSDLATDKVKKVALGEPKTVPAGQYANEVLTYFKILDKVQPKTVLGNDVREVLTWVETGNADAGIVYATDAKISNKVKVVATASENSHKPVLYPVAAIKDSKNIEAAKEFIQFLSGDKAKAIFEKYGFKTTK